MIKQRKTSVAEFSDRHFQNCFCFEEEFQKNEILKKDIEEKKAIEALPHFQKAETDNELLFNMQFDYYHGNPAAMKSMFVLLKQIAVKLIKKECRAHRIIYTPETREEVAIDATALMIEQFVKNRLKITNTFISYLYLQVRKVMYTRTEAQKLETYCRDNNIPLFELSEAEKQAVKADFIKQNHGVAK